MFVINPKRQRKLLPALLCTLVLPVYLHAEPVTLHDHEMDSITAGSLGNNTENNGGVITSTHSSSVFNTNTKIVIRDNVQQVSKGINLVNSNNSMVANTMNLWDGNVVSFAPVDTGYQRELEINQVNNINQSLQRNAMMTGYSRPGNEYTNIEKHSKHEAYLNETADIHAMSNNYQEMNNTFTSSDSKVNTLTKFSLGNKIHFEGNLGQGVAVAGHANFMLDGGSIEIGTTLGSGIGESTTIGNDLGSVSAGFNISASIGLTAKVDLPKMNIVIDGAGCGVVMGSCHALNTVAKFNSINFNQSQLDVIENHRSADNSYSDEHIQVSRSAVSVDKAKADYIVIDDSKLNLDSDISLELAGNAQKDAEGMNIVNAAGSNVANSTNISRASQFKTQRSSLVLNQFNTVIHGNP